MSVPSPASRGPIDAGARIGHVHLKVADLDRALAFYVGVLGFELQVRMGDSAAFVGAGGYHHHIGLNTWQSAGAAPPPPGHTGLFHVAILYPSRALLADALRRVAEGGDTARRRLRPRRLRSALLRDPDDNGIELYRDRPREEWPRDSEGRTQMYTWALDVRALLAEA